MNHRDWTTDERPFGECLLAWEAGHGWSSAEAARQLMVAYKTYREWRPDGRFQCSFEPSLRLLMTLIDRQAA
jgi:hypothetical protein